MIQLMRNEIHRALKNKVWISVIVSIPIMSLILAHLSLKANQILSSNYLSTMYTFPLYLPRHKIFTIYIFSIVVLLVVNSIAAEYEDSSIRMIMIRGYNSVKIFICKMVIIGVEIALFLLCWVIVSYLIGWWLMPHLSNIDCFLSTYPPSNIQLFQLTLKYYGWLYIILGVFSVQVCFIAIVTRNVIITTVTGLGSILCSLGFYMVTQLLEIYFPIVESDKLNMIALPLIQLKGLYLLIKDGELFEPIILVLGGYYLLFFMVSIAISRKQDQFI